MTYTAPAGNAANFVETGGTWTPPAGNAANLVEGASVGGGGVVISAPLRVEVAPRPGVTLFAPLRVQIATPFRLSAPLPVVVLDPAVLGGLGGTTADPGGWSAAPAGTWCAIVQIGGIDYSDRLTGVITVRSEENAARIAEISILPAAPMQPLGIIGKTVAIHFGQLLDGQPAKLQLLFTGFVDRPSVDASTGVLTLSCTDRAQYMWDRMSREQILMAMDGQYSPHVNADPDSGYEFLEEIMRSQQASWALTAERAPARLSWDAGELIEIFEPDIVHGSLSIEMPRGEEVLSSARVFGELRVPVLRERTARARWAIDMYTLMTSGADGLPVRWPLASMVREAYESVSEWSLVGPVQIVHPPSGVLWSRPDAGVFFIGAEAAASLALGADAAYRRRWVCESTRRISRLYVSPQNADLNPTAPDSLQRGVSIISELPHPEWASDLSIMPIPKWTEQANDRWERWYSSGATEEDLNLAVEILSAQAIRDLVASARTGRVQFALPCRPPLWLGQRVRLDTARVLAQGQVIAVEHVMDFSEGSAVTHVELAIMPPAAAPAFSARSTVRPGEIPPVSNFGAFSFEIGGPYIGGKEHAPEWTDDNVGFSTNSLGVYPGSNLYPYQFTMRAPGLSDSDLREIQGESVEVRTNIVYTPGILEIRS